jgi:hypothetical protein
MPQHTFLHVLHQRSPKFIRPVADFVQALGLHGPFPRPFHPLSGQPSKDGPNRTGPDAVLSV